MCRFWGRRVSHPRAERLAARAPTNPADHKKPAISDCNYQACHLPRAGSQCRRSLGPAAIDASPGCDHPNFSGAIQKPMMKWELTAVNGSESHRIPKPKKVHANHSRLRECPASKISNRCHKITWPLCRRSWGAGHGSVCQNLVSPFSGQ
jgi:hypothetical protein